MLNTKFTPWPSFTEEEGDAIKNVLLSNKVNYWTGTECRNFEKEFATWCNTEHAIALSSNNPLYQQHLLGQLRAAELKAIH